MLLSALVLHQVPDEIPTFIAGIDQNDRCSRHGAALIDRYFISQKGEGASLSIGFILTGHY